jgi:hypothetical protein
LKLDRLDHETFIPDGRSITIRFNMEESFASGATQLSVAREAIKSSDIGGTVAVVTGNIGTARGVVSQGANWLQPLTNVASKLETFIKIMDATAKVEVIC